MKVPSIPVDEEARIEALAELAILDTPPEEVFDRCLEMAAKLCGTSRGAVSLVDRERQWFKAVFGRLPKETAREVSFCGHAVAEDDVLVVNDTHEDPRFADNPLVAAPGGIRFYAGVPLHGAGGQPLGTLCVIHDEPHALTNAQLVGLRVIAEHLETILMLRLLALRQAAMAKDGRSSHAALQASEERRRETTAMLVHDLKNPLAVVTLIANFASSHELPPALAGALTDLAASVEVANQIVCDVLDVASSEHAGLRANIKPFDLPKLVGRLVRRVHYLAAERGQSVEIVHRLGDPLIRGDAALIDRALRNFLDNAFKYGPPNGTVRVVLRDASGNVELRVEDDGPSVPEALREKLFEPFFHEELAASRPSHGLGLALCAAVARAHGGTAWVETMRSGLGNAFCLRLPYAAA